MAFLEGKEDCHMLEFLHAYFTLSDEQEGLLQNKSTIWAVIFEKKKKKNATEQSALWPIWAQLGQTDYI